MKESTLSRRQFLIAAGALSGAAVLAACQPTTTPATEGGQEPVAEAPVEPTATTGTSSSLPEGQGTKVFTELEAPPEPPAFEGGPNWTPQDLTGKGMTLWGLKYDPHIDRYNVLAETFNRRTGATVAVEPQDWPIDEKVMTAMAAGSAPDVICWMGYVSEPVFSQKAVAPIGEAVFDPLGIDSNKWWFPGGIGPYTYEGEYYGVPVENEWDGYTVTGRIDLIQEAGADAQALWPGSKGDEGLQFESYDDLFALAELLQKKDDAGTVSMWGLNSTGWEPWSLFSMIRSMDVQWWDEANKKFNLDNDEAVEALKLLVEIPFQRGIEGVLGMSHVNAFVAGQLALGRGNGTTAGEAWKVAIEGENVIAPPPVKGGKSLWTGSGGWGFEVPWSSKDNEVGIEFMRFMCTYEGQLIFSQIYGGSPPATRGIVDSDIYKGDHAVKVGMRRQLKALENFEFWGFGFGRNWQAPVTETITSLREGKITSEQAAQQMQEGLTNQYEEWLSESEL
ncbi:MAG: substrate-binding domain-containing protein [Anaerolineae bacterium]